MSYRSSGLAGPTLLVVALGVLVLGSFWAWPQYRVYNRQLDGEAQLKEAEFSKRIQVEEAQADLDSAKLKSQAEVERAKGVAEANAIIGESLEHNEAYLRYLWIQGLHDGSSEVIYIPTEGNMPILEAGRMNKRAPAPPPAE